MAKDAEWRRWIGFLQVLVAGACLAADKNGVSPGAISLPKGPGSIEGLGESFQPNLNTGTAKYGIGLKLPPGVAGHAPALGLSYEGGGGNGPLGYGWQISSPCVQRRSDRGMPTYGEDIGFPHQDTFINDMREELVPQTNGFYFCKNEGAFIRYQQIGVHWQGTMPDGTRLEFGLSDNGRIEEAATGHVFSWLLERETDTRGNVILYTYSSFAGESNRNQKYLSTFRYGPGGPPWTNYHFVRLEYEDRLDWFEDCRAGFIVRTGKRLKSIRVGTQGPSLAGHVQGDFDGDGTPDFLDRRYDLEYLRYAGTNSHWSLLAKVVPVGADGVSTLPASTFGYAVCDPPAELSVGDRVIGATNEPPIVMDNELVEFVDLNGDGLPDILKTEFGGGGHQAFFNRGEISLATGRGVRWDPPTEVGSDDGGAWNFHLSSPSTHLADMDGDGLADLVHKSAENDVFYFSNLGRGAWGERQAMAVQDSPPPAPFGEPDVRTADLDFDKRMDVVQSISTGGGVAYRIWFNLGDQTYAPAITIEQEEGFSFSDPAVQIADCNGDRVPDVARVQAERVVVAAGLGYGRFAQPITMPLLDYTLDDSQVTRAKLTDLNGDGLADLVLERAAPGQCWYWLNLGNYAFSLRKGINGLPTGIGVKAAIRWADINGNGTTDLVYADHESSPRIQAVDLGELLDCGATPNILVSINNGLGRVTLIEYKPSTAFALEDAAAGRPWPNLMPIVLSVVSGTTNLDSLGHQYVNRFRYHDGYYDSQEKQFRGFARVEQIDIGDSTAPTLITRSYFDTGHEFEVMKGKLLRLTTEQEDGKVFGDAITTWKTPPVVLMTGTNGQNVSFVHPVSQLNLIKELGQGTERQLESEFSYDNYGNPTRQVDYGIVVDGDRSAFNDERMSVTEYALNLDRWIIHLPKRQEVQDENGSVISRAELYFDDETFSGTNLGEVTIGNVTLTRAWIDPSKPSAYINSARSKYDVYGNLVTSLDALAVAPGGTIELGQGHVREIRYDEQFHTYATQETIHVGNGNVPLNFRASYDAGFGTVLRSLDFNENATSYAYDVFGRPTQLIKPGDTLDYPTAEYDYALAVPFGADGLVNFVETRQRDKSEIRNPKSEMYLISRQFTDGLGRTLMTKQEDEPAPGSNAPRVVVSGAVLFNARQKPQRTLNPCFMLQPGSKLDDLLAYENIEAPGWKGAFHENGQLVELELAAAHQASVICDATLRTIQAINPDGTVNRTIYEPLVTKSYDENDTDAGSTFYDTPLVQYHDGLGRLIRVDEINRLNDDSSPSTELKSWTTAYQYDLNDRLIRITDSQGNVKTMEYDGLTRKTSMNDPDCGLAIYTYDDTSNLLETTDAKGQRSTYTYDGVNRMLTEDYHDENSPEFRYHRTPDVTYFYDQPVASVDSGDATQSSARNTKGMLAYVLDASGEEHSSYDARDRVEWTIKRIPDPMLNPKSEIRNPKSLVSYRTAFEYDSLDRVTRLTYPDNDQITYEYNARSLLQQIIGGPSGSVISSIRYLPSAQQAQIDYGNGVRTSYQYDRRMRLENLATQKTNSATELIHFGYAFDAVSNIRAIEDRRPTSAVSATDNRRNTQTFTYDDLYRLTRVQYSPLTLNPQPSTNFINYRYDRIGNMLAQTSDIAHIEKGFSVTDVGTMAYGGAAGRLNRVGRQPNDPPGPHALTSITQPSTLNPQPRIYSYDANGNMTHIDGLACTWDFKDRLVAVEDDEMRAEYTYDYTDRRITKRVVPKNSLSAPGGEGRGEVVTTLYVGKHFEIREHDQPTKYVFNGGVRVARITSSLSTNSRIQRFRLYPGWNLVSLAVTATNALQQLNAPSAFGGEGQGKVVFAAYQWNPQTGDYSLVVPGQTVSAGAVLWVKANANATLGIVGTYTDPDKVQIQAGGTYLPSFGLEAWSLDQHLPPMVSAWRYDSETSRWHARLAGDLSFMTGLPRYLAPGQAIYVKADAGADLQMPDPTLSIRYYHQDHLGSSGVITDADGVLVEETAFYPYGVPRHEYRLRQVDEHYKFTQKERDQESGLHYFEARYLAGHLSRFVSADPKYVNPDTLPAGDSAAFLSSPQEMNLYAYGRNNPLRYVDPTGLDKYDYIEYRKQFQAGQKAMRESGVTIGVDWELVSDISKVANFGLADLILPDAVVEAKGAIAEVVIGGLSCAETLGAGCALALHGIDQLQAQVRGTRPVTAQAITKITGSETAGDVGNALIGVGLSLGTKLPSCPVPGPTVAPAVLKSEVTIETLLPSSGRVGAKGQSVIGVANTAEHSATAIAGEAAYQAQLARKMEYIHRRIAETAPQRAAAMDAFNRGYNTKGAGAIIKMIGDEALAIFGNLSR